MIFLASPYTHPDKTVREERYGHALNAVVAIAKAGLPVYSPIVHWHLPALHHDLPKDGQFWFKIASEPFLLAAEEFWVLKLDGWQKSEGVRFEQQFFSMWSRPDTSIRFVLPEDQSDAIAQYKALRTTRTG